METATSGFRKTGIYPFDKEKFRDYAFASEVPDNVPAERSSSGNSIQDISPIPSLRIQSPSNRGPKRGTAVVLTSSPYKNGLSSKAAASRKQRLDVVEETTNAPKRSARKGLWETTSFAGNHVGCFWPSLFISS